jgi:hypothetical protein
MAGTTALYALTSTQVLELFKSNTITVEEYASSLLGYIEERDSTVKAWEYLGWYQGVVSFDFLAQWPVTDAQHQTGSSYCARLELSTKSPGTREARCMGWRWVSKT